MLQTAKHSKINSHLVRSFLDLLRARREIVEKGKTAIVTNCKAYSSHFKVKSLGQIFSRSFVCAAKLLRRKERYCYKLQSIQQSFQSKITRSDIIFFLRSFASARHEIIKKRPPLLPTAKHFTVISK